MYKAFHNTPFGGIINASELGMYSKLDCEEHPPAGPNKDDLLLSNEELSPELQDDLVKHEASSEGENPELPESYGYTQLSHRVSARQVPQSIYNTRARHPKGRYAQRNSKTPQGKRRGTLGEYANELMYSTPMAKRPRYDQGLTPGEEYCGPTPRRERGLKKLSVRVRDMVFEKKSTTYKQVANELIKEFEIPMASTEKEFGEDGSVGCSDEEHGNKEEKNVRRRVYDALNVLIAAGVLKKHGKNVSKEEHP